MLDKEGGKLVSNKKNITVYWAPAQFTTEDIQWNFFYSDPRAVSDNLVTNTTEDSLMVKCPAARGALRNVYSFHSNIDEDIDLSGLNLSSDSSDNSDEKYQLPVDSTLALYRLRKSSFKNYVNVSYNMGWIFFSDEPLTARIVSPYYPSRTPTPGAIMATGELDIGQWYRPMNLDYHIPYDATIFSVKTNEPLAFVEFKTEKSITFKRYQLTPLLHNLAGEFAASAQRFGQKISLIKRYEMANRAKMASLVLSEIKKNVIEGQ